jgi:hypothetical protein
LVIAAAAQNREQVFGRNQRRLGLHRQRLARPDVFGRIESRLIALACCLVGVKEDSQLRSAKSDRNASRGEWYLPDAPQFLPRRKPRTIEALDHAAQLPRTGCRTVTFRALARRVGGADSARADHCCLGLTVLLARVAATRRAGGGDQNEGLQRGTLRAPAADRGTRPVSHHNPLRGSQMSKLLRGLAAGYGAKKLGGGCFSTILIFILLWWLLGNFGVFQ